MNFQLRYNASEDTFPLPPHARGEPLDGPVIVDGMLFVKSGYSQRDACPARFASLLRRRTLTQPPVRRLAILAALPALTQEGTKEGRKCPAPLALP